MSGGREQEVLGAFVSIARSLAEGYDTVDLYNGLTADCARLLDIASSGLLLADPRGVLHLMAASSDQTHELEAFQLQRHEGPCLDCYRDGAPVLIPDLSEHSDRWPHFVPAATQAGFASVHALPMRLQDTMLGTLGLFGTAAGKLNEDDLRLGQALADVASIALIADKAATDKDAVNAQLQTALASRVVLEQAKGLLAQLGDLDMERSFAALRGYARAHSQKLSEVANALVNRELPAQLVLDHARATSPPPPA